MFLAAMMVLSVVAMSASFAGAAAAEEPPEANVTYDYDGAVVWQGQDVTVTGDDIGDPAGDEYDDYELRSVDSFDGGVVDSSSFVEELEYDDGEIVVETDDLDAGDYFVRGGDLPRSPAETDTFEVAIQDLDVAFDDEVVDDEGADAVTDLDIDSDRGTYSLNVSADGDLDDEELYNIFTSSADDATDYDELTAFAEVDENDDLVVSGDAEGEFNVFVYDSDEDDADEKILLHEINDREEEVNFTDIDTGEYTFTFEVHDTEAEATADITVEEEDVDASFDRGVYTQAAGDIVEFTVDLEDTDDAYIQFGDEDAGFVDVLYIEDDDDSGDVTFMVNTRLVGAEGPDGEQVYYSEDDVVESHLYDGTDAEFWDDDVDEDDLTYEAYLEELNLIDDAEDENGFDQLVRPLQPTTYDVAANGNQHFIVDDGESDLDDEIGFATLDLVTPGVDSVTTHVAPEDDADEDDDLEDVRDIVTERTEIAEDDRLIVKTEATGLYGSLLYAEDDWDALEDGFSGHSLYTITEGDDWGGEGITFEVEADDAIGNQDPTSLDLEDADEDDVFILVDNDAGEMYVIVDTSSSDAFDRSLDPEQEFTATLEYEADDDDRFKFWDDDDNRNVLGGADGDRDEAAYPYFQPGETEVVTAAFTVVEPDAAFDNLDAEERVQVVNDEEAIVSGTTNVAPGSDADVRVTSDGDVEPAFTITADAEIAEDGSFEATVDLADNAEGDTGDALFRVGGSTIADEDLVVVEAVDEDPDMPAEFDVDADAPAEVEPGADASLDVTVSNTGDEAGTTSYEVVIDGQTVAEDDLELDGGESTSESYDFDTADEGDIDWSVTTDDDSAAGTLTVAEEEVDDEVDDDVDDEEPADDDEQPGFGVAVAVVALLAAAMLALRRQN